MSSSLFNKLEVLQNNLKIGNTTLKELLEKSKQGGQGRPRRQGRPRGQRRHGRQGRQR